MNRAVRSRRVRGFLLLVVWVTFCAAASRGLRSVESGSAAAPARAIATVTAIDASDDPSGRTSGTAAPSPTDTSSAETVGAVGPAAATAPATHATRTADLVVAGDSLGGVGAAVQAGRRGHDVVLLSELGYIGGQATAAAVTSMDEASGPARDLLRSSGLYRELVDLVLSRYDGVDVATCYFRATDTLCPEPHVMRDVLDEMLADADVEVVHAAPAHAIVDGDGHVTGLTDDAGRRYLGRVVDATEFGDVLPTAGVETDIGNHGRGACVQDLTHAVVMAWYPDAPPAELVVSSGAIDTVAATVGRETVDAWLDEFRTLVSVDGRSDFTRWAELTFPIGPRIADTYRGMPDSRPDVRAAQDAPAVTVSGVNLANDVPVSRAAVEGGRARDDTYRSATLKSYLYMWYQRWELGRNRWAVASHLGFDDVDRRVWLDEIPDEIERHLPPEYYVREARRLASPHRLVGDDIAGDRPATFADSVLLGGSRSDADHGTCSVTDGAMKVEHGEYEVPLSVFVPPRTDGLLVGVARNGAVDRAVSSSIRMHPSELLGGQVVGMLAALATESGVPARDVPPGEVRAELRRVGALVDVPGTAPETAPDADRDGGASVPDAASEVPPATLRRTTRPRLGLG